jgi:ABC-type transport system involved in multi-copper enzyme maturation permease subunit
VFERALATWREGDASDALSPIVVKEVRQGVRKRAFTGTLVILQLLMVLALSMALGEDKNVEGSTWMFWILMAAPVALAPAAAGAVSIGEERKLNTLDSLLLTSLSPRRIVFGKWSAAFAQTLLLATSVLPYVLMRYFIGGIDLVAEIIGFALLLLGAAVLTALHVGMSNVRGKTPGSGAALLVLALLMLSSGLPLVGAVLAVSRLNPLGIVPALLAGALTLALVLEGAALHLAHPAEKRPALLRGLAFLAVPVALWGSKVYMGGGDYVLWGWAGLLGLITAVVSVSEPRHAIASLHQPWLRDGLFRRLTRWFLAPGWPSGVGFATALVLAWALVFPVAARSSLVYGRFAVLLGAILLPVPLMRRFLPRARRETLAWMFLQILAAIPAAVTGFAWALGAEGLRPALPYVMALNPFLTFFDGLGDAKPPHTFGLAVAVICVAAAWREAALGWAADRRLVEERTP